MRIYFDFNDWWIGYYRGDTHHYICPLPTVVIRWDRMSRRLWWFRRLLCIVLGHIPDGIVRVSGETWCKRRCGWGVTR